MKIIPKTNKVAKGCAVRKKIKHFLDVKVLPSSETTRLESVLEK